MAIIHLGFAKARDDAARIQCNRFIGLVREKLCGNSLHPTFPPGVYLRFTHEGHRTGIMVEYAPEVEGASDTAVLYAAKAEELWNEVFRNMYQKPHELILARAKTDGWER